MKVYKVSSSLVTVINEPCKYFSKLEKKIDLGPDSGLAKLPLPLNTKLGLNAKNSLATKEAMIAGFGWDKVEIKTVEMEHVGKFQTEEGSSSGKLLKAKARILANNVCQRYFVSTFLDSQLCANIVEHDKKVDQGVYTVSIIPFTLVLLQ